MGWLRSHGQIRVGPRTIDGYYIKDDWSSMLLKFGDSGYSDWFVSNDCVIRFKVTSQETGDMDMQLNGEINGYPYYSNGDWNLWNTGENYNSWILANRYDGPGLGEPPVASYSWDYDLSSYAYDGDEYYSAGSFNYTCLDGTAGTFTNNLSGNTITLSAVWPTNFKKRTSGNTNSIVGNYAGGFHVGFHQWKATVNGIDYYIHKLKRRQYGHLHSFDSTDLDGAVLQNTLVGIYHDEFGIPNLDTNAGFYFHTGYNAYPTDGTDYVLKWCHYVPDEGQSYDGHIEFSSDTHPDITFVYQGDDVFETDVENDNKGLIYMTDASCWR